MNRLGVYLFPPGWDASPFHGYPEALGLQGPVYDNWVERGTVRPRTRRNVPGQGSRSGDMGTNNETAAPHIETGGYEQIPRVNLIFESNQIKNESHFLLYCKKFS